MVETTNKYGEYQPDTLMCLEDAVRVFKSRKPQFASEFADEDTEEALDNQVMRRIVSKVAATDIAKGHAILKAQGSESEDFGLQPMLMQKLSEWDTIYGNTVLEVVLENLDNMHPVYGLLLFGDKLLEDEI